MTSYKSDTFLQIIFHFLNNLLFLNPSVCLRPALWSWSKSSSLGLWLPVDSFLFWYSHFTLPIGPVHFSNTNLKVLVTFAFAGITTGVASRMKKCLYNKNMFSFWRHSYHLERCKKLNINKNKTSSYLYTYTVMHTYKYLSACINSHSFVSDSCVYFFLSKASDGTKEIK